MDRRIVRAGQGRKGLMVLVSVFVAGCGGSSSPGRSTAATTPPGPSTAPASAAPTRAAFIAQADRICRTSAGLLNAQQRTIDAALQADQTSDTPANRAALAAALRRDEILVTPQLNRLRVLAPVADRVVVGRYLASVASQIQLIEQFAVAVEKQDRPALNVIAQQLTQGKATATSLAQGYGLQVCGSQ
jgi:hypothetical protein